MRRRKAAIAIGTIAAVTAVTVVAEITDEGSTVSADTATHAVSNPGPIVHNPQPVSRFRIRAKIPIPSPVIATATPIPIPIPTPSVATVATPKPVATHTVVVSTPKPTPKQTVAHIARAASSSAHDWATRAFSIRVANCESGGGPSDHNSTYNGNAHLRGKYSGKWQDDASFWSTYGGLTYAASPADATEDQQDAVNYRGYQARGWGPWQCASMV